VQPPKTLWDWLQLLIVPAILVAVTFAWSASQTASNNEREDKRIEADNEREDRRIKADRAAAEQVRQDTTLDDYIQQMSDLVLDRRLPSSKETDGVRSVARSVTLTTLRRLDGERKGEVVRFLLDARLISLGLPPSDEPGVVDLDGANLTGADLEGADLFRVDFSDANLTRANLRSAFIPGADFFRADLTAAVLDHANLTSAHFGGADLRQASLIDAGLLDASLQGADLTGADLTGADLTGANLRHANLTDAILTGADLTGANLTGAKGLPPGSR